MPAFDLKNEVSEIQRFKDSGVKKLVILGLVENGLETYHNIEVLMQKVGVNSLSFAKSMSVDLKMVNLLIGKKISHFNFCASNSN